MYVWLKCLDIWVPFSIVNSFVYNSANFFVLIWPLPFLWLVICYRFVKGEVVSRPIGWAGWGLENFVTQACLAYECLGDCFFFAELVFVHFNGIMVLGMGKIMEK